MYAINDNDGLDNILIIACMLYQVIYLICTNLNKARNSKSTCISKITHLDSNFIRVSNYQNYCTCI